MKGFSQLKLRAYSKRIIELLRASGCTLSVAESCTGGLIAKALTDISGASSAFCGGCVTYTNEVKMELLGVPSDLIARESEVSYACAKAMAEGVRDRLHTSYAISTTGYAGPDGGTEADPVGTVYIGIATPHASYSARYCAPEGSGRTEVRVCAAGQAFALLEQELLRDRA